VESLDPNLSAFWRLKAWNELETYPNEAIQPPIEELPTGTDLQRKDWVSLNRARAKVGRTASTLHKWKVALSSECTCGHPNQTVNHILSECPQGPHCTDQDLRECNETARVWITHWRDKIWWWWWLLSALYPNLSYVLRAQITSRSSKENCWLESGEQRSQNACWFIKSDYYNQDHYAMYTRSNYPLFWRSQILS